MEENNLLAEFENASDFLLAQENIRLIMKEIREVKPKEINFNPIDNEISFKDTTIKWKLKPKMFDIIKKIILGGDVVESILKTPFTVALEYDMHEFSKVWLKAAGVLKHFDNFSIDKEFKVKIGATFRF